VSVPRPCEQSVESPPVDWLQFRNWAHAENDYQKSIAGVHGQDHGNPDLRGRTYFEVNVYRYFHALQVCWPYLNRPNQKVMDVGSWPGAWMRVIANFCSRHQPRIWACGLIFPERFLEKMGGACQGMLHCELDPQSPMRDKAAPTSLSEGGFTFVSAMEVVEHLYDPRGMFELIGLAMEPGGVLFVTTNNIARLSNLFTLATGGGLAGNLDELNPRDGGILGNWRPHAREYAWQDLNQFASAAGFHHLTHGFYQENYARRLVEGAELPREALTIANPRERRFAEAIRPLLAEPEQLKSGMYVLFERL